MGVDPAVMGIGPSAAIPPAVKSAGLELNDINLYEINEVHDFIAEDFLVKPEQAKYFNLFFFFSQAFASQYVFCCKKLEIDPEKVNVNGGAIALGHPLGATGI